MCVQVVDVLKLVEEKELYPMIVFSFARIECETFAMNTWTESEKSGKLDFTTDEEKEAIEHVRSSALCLCRAEVSLLHSI